MKTLNFYFDGRSLNGALEYLKRHKADPVMGKSDDEAIEAIKAASIHIFKRQYEGKAVHSFRVNDGLLLGPVLWRGLMCTFGSFNITSEKSPVSVEVDISKEFSASLNNISVNFYGHLAPANA